MRSLVLRIADQRNSYSIDLLEGTLAEDGALTTSRVTSAKLPHSLVPERKVLRPDRSALAVPLVRKLYDATAGHSEEFEALGVFVFRLLARGDVAAEWQRLRGQVTRTILDIAPSLRDLHALPWELMYDPESGTHLFLDAVPMLRGEPRSLSERNPEVSPGVTQLAFAADDWPLRVLIIFGAGPEYAGGRGLEGDIGAKAELEALETLFAAHRFDVEFEVVENPTRPKIADACGRVMPHVLHFIGHGDARGEPKDHRLLMYRKTGGAMGEYATWAPGDIRSDLNGIPLRFAFLNACRTSEGAAAAEQETLRSAFNNLSDAFVRNGALGAVAMQGDIPGDLAAEFSRVFYEQILAGHAVDEAVLRARLRVAQSREDVLRRGEWSYPVLRTRVHPELVLPRRPAGPVDDALVKRFVPRLPERRLVCDAVQRRQSVAGAATNGESPHFVALIGHEEAGKSHLAKWCKQVCVRNNLRATYVEFARNDSVDVIAALRWIRDGHRPPTAAGVIKSSPSADLPARAFRRFNWHLNYHLRGVSDVPPLPPEGVEIDDEGIPLAQSQAPVETIIDDTMRQFCLALEEAARPNGLVLVLDQIEGLEATTLSQWLPRGLFQPVASGLVKGVRIVVGTRQTPGDQSLSAFSLGRVVPTKVSIEYFKPDDFERLARSLCLQWSPEAYKAFQKVQHQLVEKYVHGGPWRAGLLKMVDEFGRMFQ